MKHTIKLLAAIVLAVGLSARMEAKPVDKAIATHLAAQVLNKAVVDATPSRFTGCHLFTGADGKGFVLLAADDRIRPVLAYSPDGSFDPDAMPDHVASWIEGYQQEIASVTETCDSPSRRWPRNGNAGALASLKAKTTG